MKKLLIVLLSCIMLCSCSKEAIDEGTNADRDNLATSVLETLETLGTTTVTEITNLQIENPDIRNLKWGMSIDEVKKYEQSEYFNEETKESVVPNQIKTLIKYRNVQFLDYTTTLVLCVVDGIGLNGVNYYVSSNSSSETYKDIYDYYYSEYGEPTFTNDWSVSWDVHSEKYSIMMIDNDTTVQVSFFPLSET